MSAGDTIIRIEQVSKYYQAGNVQVVALASMTVVAEFETGGRRPQRICVSK